MTTFLVQIKKMQRTREVNWGPQMKYRYSHQMAGMLLLAGTIVLGGCLPDTEPLPPTAEEMIERGRYLVTLAGCNDCHTPKVFSGSGTGLDESRLLSGHPADVAMDCIWTFSRMWKSLPSPIRDKIL